MESFRAASQRPGAQSGVGFGSGVWLVALGGAAGTFVRYGLGLWWADAAVTTLVVNLVGAFALGALVPMLGRLSNSTRAERLRLLLGTGVLGGFTTYSGLATLTGEALLGEQVPWALGYAGVTLVAGLMASLVGMWVGGLGARREGDGS